MTSPPVVLGFDFGGTKTSVAVARADGCRLAGRTIATAADLGARRCVDNALRVAAELVETVGAVRLVAAAASTFGVPQGDRIALAPAVADWQEIDLRARVADAFDVPVEVVNDVKAAAVAEVESGALAGCDPGIYVNVGTGVAVAIVVRGRSFPGAHGASGEIGYNLSSYAEVGRALDGSAPLEALIGGRALAAGGGEPSREALEQLARILGLHLVNLCNAIDPERVVIGGGLTRSWEILGPAIRSALDAAVPFPPDLRRAEHPLEAPLIGALVLAARSYSRQAQSIGPRDARPRVDAALAAQSPAQATPGSGDGSGPPRKVIR